MTLKIQDNCLIVAQDKSDLTSLVDKILEIYDVYKSNDIVIQLEDSHTVLRETMTPLIGLSTKHRLTKQSFVVVCKGLDLDTYPEDFMIVPTLQEASDLIEMEHMERDLGF